MSQQSDKDDNQLYPFPVDAKSFLRTPIVGKKSDRPENTLDTSSLEPALTRMHLDHSNKKGITPKDIEEVYDHLIKEDPETSDIK